MRNLEEINKAILKGSVVDAEYKLQQLSDYEDNPFIEALPPIFSPEEVFDRFINIPRITLEDKKHEKNVRYHVLKRIKNFNQPLPIHFEMERRLSTLIRRGYLARNPIKSSYLEINRCLNKLDDEEVYSQEQINRQLAHIRSTADSLAIIGISGIGKTTAIERLLLMYPQVIRHSKYDNKLLLHTQIVWLKIDCPYDGSLSTLFKSFFKAVDDLLGTRYLEKFGSNHRVTSTMMLYMTKIASMHGIGVLVIDEIQHLLHAKEDQEEMLNFFVTLSNTVGIPTVLIGTSKAEKLFKGNFRQARRAASEGAIIWDRMEEHSEEWDYFLETLWELQCLKTYSELTPEIKKTFYEEAQGITSVAVNLFILAQERVLFDESNTNEIITPSILRKTAKEDMKMIQPMLNALRKNDLSAISKYDDITINLDELMLNHKQQYSYHGRVKEAMKERVKTVEFKKQSTIENLVIEMVTLGIFPSLSQNDINKKIEKIVKSNPVEIGYNELKLLAIKELILLNNQMEEEKTVTVKVDSNLKVLSNLSEKALKKKEHPYYLLQKNSYIKDPIAEFY